MEQIDAKRRGRHPPGRAAASSMPGQRLERHAQAVPQQRPSRRFGQQQCAHAQSSAAYASASGSSQRLPQAASIAAGGSRGAAGEVEGAAISGSATTGEAAGSRGASWAVAEGLGQRAKRSAARERADARGCRGTGAAVAGKRMGSPAKCRKQPDGLMRGNGNIVHASRANPCKRGAARRCRVPGRPGPTRRHPPASTGPTNRLQNTARRTPGSSGSPGPGHRRPGPRPSGHQAPHHQAGQGAAPPGERPHPQSEPSGRSGGARKRPQAKAGARRATTTPEDGPASLARTDSGRSGEGHETTNLGPGSRRTGTAGQRIPAQGEQRQGSRVKASASGDGRQVRAGRAT